MEQHILVVLIIAYRGHLWKGSRNNFFKVVTNSDVLKTGKLAKTFSYSKQWQVKGNCLN